MTSTYHVEFDDTFRGDNAALIRCVHALLELDALGALVPHGVGGHARGLLSAAAARLQALPPGIEQAALDELETCRAVLPGLQRDHDSAMDERNEARQSEEEWKNTAYGLAHILGRLHRENPGILTVNEVAHLTQRRLL